jgi:H+/gluconate symporter-like permease
MPLHTPGGPWESISMDYMSGLPSIKHGNDSVFVVVDHFSKMTIMTTYKKSITVEATANLFFKSVWVHFGLPETIISDWNNKFLRNFW